MSTVYELQTQAIPPPAGNRSKFPALRYSSAASYGAAYADEMAQAWKTVDLTALDLAAEILTEAYSRRAGVFACGNGGSASIANHLQCDHLKGVRTGTDLVPRVISLSNNAELLTAIANDLAYEEVFAYQLQSQATAGDVLVAISSSGRSANIVRALTWASEHDLRTIAITGFEGGAARTIADVAIHVNCTNYGIVEDLHQAVMHLLAQYIRQSRMTSEAISAGVF
jgi:D-sedoheptulose 7-phosphate isomerase/D-glycero-D-manno-heptose 1,7-bisphosphate phosphatase